MRKRKPAAAFTVPSVVMIPHEQLNLAPYNPNEMTSEERAALRASIIENGFVENCVVQKYSQKFRLANVLVGGHQRLCEARAIRVETGDHSPFLVPCVVLDLTDTQAMKLNVALNKIRGKPDPLKLGALFAQIAPQLATKQDVLSTGYTLSEVERLIRNTRPPPPPGADDDVIPEPPRVPVTKIGDVWQLGDHILVCGDSFDAPTRELGLRGQVVDLVLTDPPYAIYGSSSGIGADIADDRMVRPFFEALFRLMEQSVKPFGHVYVCCDWRSYAAIQESSRVARVGGAYGLWPKNCIVWDKGGSGLGNCYGNTHEFVAFFARLPTPKAMKGGAETGQRLVLKPNIFKANRPSGGNREHNAAKSPELFRYLIENSSDPRELVVDFFGGSGTTLVAAEQLKRRAVVFEVDPRYCDVIIERWQRLTSGKAERIRNAA